MRGSGMPMASPAKDEARRNQVGGAAKPAATKPTSRLTVVSWVKLEGFATPETSATAGANFTSV